MKTIRVGRGSNNDVVIKDGVVSTNHAVITVSDLGEITIEDLNSKNGTFVDGKRVNRAKLSTASVVLLGNHSIDWKQMIQTAAGKPAVSPKPPVTLPDDVTGQKLIGRSLTSQIRFSFDDVSDRHAWLYRRKDGSIWIIDNHSTNGTYVNGSRITGPCRLRKGDNVSVSNKHPLNWEAVYPLRMNPNYKLILSIAASVALIVGICLLQPWRWDLFKIDKDWTEVYSEHKNDVVLIYLKSAYATTIQGRPLSEYMNGYDKLDYCYIDDEGDVTPGIMRSSGTGFFISKDGKFLTNRHVVSSSGDRQKNEDLIKRTIQSALLQNDLMKLAANIEVDYVTLSVGIAQNDTYIDNESNLIPCTVLSVSKQEELDVAILQTNSKSIPGGSSYVDLSQAVPSSRLSVGDGICTIGFPKSFVIGQTSVGLEANNQSGEITQERGAYEYGHNITIHQGASGSPVFNKKGKFAGIIVSGFLGISQGYNHAIHPTPILEFVGKSY